MPDEPQEATSQQARPSKTKIVGGLAGVSTATLVAAYAIFETQVAHNEDKHEHEIEYRRLQDDNDKLRERLTAAELLLSVDKATLDGLRYEASKKYQ